MQKRIGRPSPAMIVALIALFVALGGSVYAANKINGKTIKKGTLPGNRLKPNTVTGKQVKESALRIVGLQCPGDTTYVAGVCLETAQRAPQTGAAANPTCLAAGRFLPSKQVMFVASSKLDNIDAGGGEWIDATDANGALVARGTVRANRSEEGFDNSTGSHPFRCATAPQ